MEFREFVKSLSRLRQPASPIEVLSSDEILAANSLLDLEAINVTSLSTLVLQYPKVVPLLATCVGLSLESLKSELMHQFATSSWTLLCKNRPMELITFLDTEFGIVQAVEAQRTRDWKFLMF